MLRKEYLSSWVMGIFTVAQYVCFLFFQNEDANLLLSLIGWLIWAISIVFGFWPMFIFKKKGGVQKGQSYMHTTVLVDSGLYRIVRHPQYLAGILLNLALILVSQHWLIVCLGIPSMLIMYFEIQHADRLEIEKFGDAYRRYMEKVPQINFFAGIFRLLTHNDKELDRKD